MISRLGVGAIYSPLRVFVSVREVTDDMLLEL